MGKFSKVSKHTAKSLKKTKTGFLGESEIEDINNTFPDYPLYPSSEDIYSNYTKEEEVDIEQPYLLNTPVDKYGLPKMKESEGEITGEDLDIPGAELDDDQEYIGSEDEENNYYSLGGDNHDNLDEYRDDV